MSTFLWVLVAIPVGAAVGYYAAKVMSHVSRGWALVILTAAIIAPLMWGTDVRPWLIALAWVNGAYFGAILIIWLVDRVMVWRANVPVDPPYGDTSWLDHKDGVR